MIDQILNQGLQLVIQIFLARIIGPAESGLLALTTIFLVLSALVVTGGFPTALIQTDRVSREDISTVFVINVAIAIAVTIGLFFSAPLIASFFNEPRLTLIVRVVSISLIVSAFGQVHSAMLVKNLEFKKLFWISTPAIVISGCIGLTTAIMGYGVWALVWQRLSGGLVRTTMFWAMSSNALRPVVSRFSLRSAKRLGAYGISILGASIMYQGLQNIYGLMIGKMYLPADLGCYNRANSFQRTPVKGLNSILSRVLFPVLSSIQDDDPRIVRSLRMGMPVLAFIVTPMMALLMVTGEPLVLTLLTEEWLPTAQFLTLLPILGVIYSISAIHVAVWKAKGHSKLFFWVTTAKQGLALIILLLTIRHGVYCIVIGQVVHGLIGLAINVFLTSRVTSYAIRSQLQDVLPYFSAAAITGFITIVIVASATTPAPVTLIISVVVYSLIYLTICWLCGLQAINDTLSRIKGMLGKAPSTLATKSEAN